MNDYTFTVRPNDKISLPLLDLAKIGFKLSMPVQDQIRLEVTSSPPDMAGIRALGFVKQYDIYAAQTGNLLPDACSVDNYLGTVVTPDGSYVLHLFDVTDMHTWDNYDDRRVWVEDLASTGKALFDGFEELLHTQDNRWWYIHNPNELDMWLSLVPTDVNDDVVSTPDGNSLLYHYSHTQPAAKPADPRHNGPVMVFKFVKQDDTARKMRCRLLDIVDQNDRPMWRVWDLDNQDYRSVYPDTIIAWYVA